MTRILPIRRLAGIVAGLAGALLAFTAASPAAFAEHVPPAGGHSGTVQAPPPVYTVVTGGMPGWQITLIAAGAALAAAVLAVLLDRMLAARRRGPQAPEPSPHLARKPRQPALGPVLTTTGCRRG